MTDFETVAWQPMSIKPTTMQKCYVHAMNNFYVTAVWDSESQQFWDKDGQPVAAVIEWCYRPNRSE